MTWRLFRGLASAWLAAVALASPAMGESPSVTGVELSSPHQLPEARVRAAIGEVIGRPRLRGVVRDTLARLWALGLFSEVRVEEIPEAGGVRLRYILARRPWVRDVHVRGDLGLDIAEVTSAAALGEGVEATPERLERARRDVLVLYEREGFLEAEVMVETRDDPATNARDVTLVVRAGDRARIVRVHVRGTDRFARNFVAKAFGLKERDHYREPAVRDGVDAVERLYRDRGFFEARAAVRRTQVGPARMELELTVTEGPHTRVVFPGAKSIDESELWRRLTFADTRLVDETEVRASARQIVLAYDEQGYAFASANGEVLPDGRDRLVRFVIDEGPRVEVEDVAFPGTPLPESQVRAHIATRPGGLVRRGLFRRNALNADAQALRVFLRAQGFPEATVSEPVVTFSPDRQRARVVFPIEAGPRVVVGEIRVTGTRVFTEEMLRRLLPLKRGAPWSETQAEEGRRVLERRYARRGFHATDVSVIPRRHDGVADVTYEVQEGPQTRVGQILVSGLVQTKEYVVRRELPFQPGDPLDPEQLLEAQRRLSALAIFDRVTVEPLRPPPTPFADVTVTVRERKPWHVDFAGGYSTYEGVRGSVEFGGDNLFGTGRSILLRGRISEKGDREDLTYAEPWLLGTPWRGEVTLFHEKRLEIGYDIERYGFALGAQRDLLTEIVRGLHGAVRYELAQVDRFNVDPTLTQEDIQRGQERIGTLTEELSLDRRDHPFDPRRGSFTVVSLRAGSVILGSDADFVKSRFETQWFFDHVGPGVLGVALRVGAAAPFHRSTSLPIEERFFAGGATTVRGYRERRLGPLDDRGNPTGGNALAIVNLEWRFPIWRFIGGAVFFDTGAVASEVERMDLNHFKSGMGAGIRLTTPVGPVRLDAGYPLDDIPHESRELRFYFSIGYPF